MLEWLTTWAARDGCSQGPSVFLDTQAAFAEHWTGCQAGTEVTHYRIAGLGHTWPPPIGGRSAIEIMWSFFQAHPLQAQ